MRHPTLSLLATIAVATPAAAQFDYELTPLGTVPGAHSTVATGFNDRGEVVGWSQFFGTNPGIRAWRWSEATGFVMLPNVAGQNATRAMDINNEGVIAGDGAYDSGFAWRYEDGTYTVLGALAGHGRSWLGQINDANEVAGTSWAFQFAIPKKAFFSSPGNALTEIVQGEATAINELGQVAGWAGTFGPMRWTEAGGVESLPLAPGKSYHYAADINNRGDVVGRATHANGNSAEPFLYTDAGGMRLIGSFGGGASAASINDHRTVVGNFSQSSGGNPWVWTEATGVRFLGGLVDLGAGYSPYSAIRINERGQILVRTYSAALTAFVPAVLTPTAPEAPGHAFCRGHACPCGEDRLAGCPNTTGVGARMTGGGTSSVTANDLVLTIEGMPPTTFGLVFAGTTRVDVPLGDGRRCIDGALVRFPAKQAMNGTFSEASGIASGLSAMAGETYAFQAWYRDVGGCNATGFNLSNAYEVTFTP